MSRLWGITTVVLAVGLALRTPQATPAGERPAGRVGIEAGRETEAEAVDDVFPGVRVTAAEAFARLARADRAADPARERAAALARLDAAVEVATRPPGSTAADPVAVARVWRSVRSGLADATGAR